MKTLISLLIILASVSLASAKPFVVIVRHAEKATNDQKDPDLSPEGLVRADALAEMLKTSGIVSIFTSEFKRTIETASPTVKSLGIDPKIIPANDSDALVAELHKLTGNALVVNHSDSIPGLIKALGIDTSLDKIQENDYSEFFVVTLGSKPQLLHLHYPDLQRNNVNPQTSPAK